LERESVKRRRRRIKQVLARTQGYARMKATMVTSESVQKACSQVGAYDEEMMVSEFDRFFKAQPAICDFVVELTNESSQQIQEMTLFLSYMIFKAVEAGNPDDVGSITAGVIENAYRESETWIDKISQAGNAELPSVVTSSLEHDTEPFLLQYVIAELNESLDDGTRLDDEEKGEVFFVLKTVISSLSTQNRRIIETE
jgi:hypothetical protein